ncbi:uncharacterized protein G2W53_034309 [Senna tora]|uniref:Uncharacterized protein n=1 Tax=Senna tora TaxID=362788 RepID=A0A834W9E3_9FABA|nr:uncharacterized protein G2W53_034309 [Senna tora]
MEKQQRTNNRLALSISDRRQPFAATLHLEP